jgi:hypothetical protein
MDPQVVTLVIGVSGITATLISSGLGFYFTSQARRAPLREALFNRQLDLISRIISKQGRIQVFATVLTSEGYEFKDEARSAIGECVREFSEMQEEGAALLPTELWVEVKRLNERAADLLTHYEKAGLALADLRTFVAQSTKVGLLARTVLGVDELTDESLRLFSTEKDYARVANIEVEHFKKYFKERLTSDNT